MDWLHSALWTTDQFGVSICGFNYLLLPAAGGAKFWLKRLPGRN